MLHLFWLTKEQVEQVKPFFPKECGGGCLDDRRHRTKGQRIDFKGGDALLKDWRRIATC